MALRLELELELELDAKGARRACPWGEEPNAERE
jgi:hypothetical protein